MATLHPAPTSASARRRITLVDVAHHAGVSVATASKAVRDAYGISPAMRERVLVSARTLGYRPDRLARGMRGSTSTLGLMVPTIENSFINLVLSGITPVLRAAGYDLFIAAGSAVATEQDAAIDSLIDHQMDGIVLVGPRQSPERLEYIASLVPTVVVGRHGPAENYDTIASDDELGSELIVEHLYDLGHRRISFIAESPTIDYTTLPEHVRLRGYRDAMRRRHLDAQIDVIASEWSIAGGRRAAEALQSRPTPPTAVHAGADVAALGLLSALWEQGWDAPSQLSIAGYDNSPTAAFDRIGITSVEQGGVSMGETAAEFLIERIRGRSAPVHELRRPVLVPRRTTASVDDSVGRED